MKQFHELMNPFKLRRIPCNFFTFKGSVVTKNSSFLDLPDEKFLGVIKVGESEKSKKNRNFDFRGEIRSKMSISDLFDGSFLPFHQIIYFFL